MQLITAFKMLQNVSQTASSALFQLAITIFDLALGPVRSEERLADGRCERGCRFVEWE
jgi:hypothetical protein